MANKKVIQLPTSCVPKKQYSKELAWALRSFITECDGCYYADELDSGILKLYLKLKNGIAIEQRVQIRQDDYICYTTLSCRVDPRKQNFLLDLIQVANSINLQIDYGNFEVACHTGEIRFRSNYEPEEKVYMESLDKFLGYPMRIINIYGHLLSDVCNKAVREV